MGFFDSNQSFQGSGSYNMGLGAEQTNGYLGMLNWQDPSNTSTEVFALPSGGQSYEQLSSAQGNEMLQAFLRSWAQANSKDLSHLGAFQGDPYDSEKYATNGEFDRARYQADMDAMNAYAREQFGDFVMGRTRVSGSDSDGGTFRQDLLQRTADGYRPITGATTLLGDTGYKSDGKIVGAIIASWAGGHLLGAGAGAGAGAEAGAGAGAGAEAGAAGSTTTGVTGSNGAFLGEGVASGIPAWDSGYAAAGGTFGSTGLASNEGVLGWSAEQPVGAEGGFNPNGLPDGSPYASDFAGAGGGQAAPGAAAASGGGGSSWIPAATQAINALYQSYQSRQARDALVDAGNQANATQRYIFDTLRSDQAPYRQAGYNALDNIGRLMRDPSSVTSDPGYQFGLKEGMRSIDNSASARGGIGGAALRQGARYATDYATTKLNDVFNRNATVAGFGQVANNQGIATGTNYGNNVSQNQLWMGGAQAGNAMNQGNIYGNLLNQYGANYGRGY